ncbi:MAG: ferric reductase-like transmembrane domain-containing protein [Opitutales bacterium]|nr:ferric reductase-like transmembrane domain-containing protein [Opitutales bacterium]
MGSHGAVILMSWAFLLSTRFKPLEWLFGGLDKVYFAHRRVGVAAFSLIWLHPIGLALGMAESWPGVASYLFWPDNWVRLTGSIALLAFVLLVVLSLVSKIAYHNWKKTHDWFGAVFALVIIHAVLSPGEIRNYALLSVWHGLWAGMGLSAYVYIRFLYRRVGPLYDFKVSAVREKGDDITEIEFVPEGRPLRAVPGQFVYIAFDEADAVSDEPHPFSLSGDPESRSLKLSIKRLGDWTNDVDKVRVGEQARIWGPYGHFSETLFNHPERPAVFIAGGIGVTPFLNLMQAKALRQRPGRVTMIYSVPKKSQAVYREDLENYAKAREDHQIITHFSDDEGFIDGAYLDKILPHEIDEAIYLVCGPAVMMTAMQSLLEEAGVPSAFIVMEDFSIR